MLRFPFLSVIFRWDVPFTSEFTASPPPPARLLGLRELLWAPCLSVLKCSSDEGSSPSAPATVTASVIA